MKFKISKGSFIHLGCRFNCKNNFSLDTGSTVNQYCHLDNRGGIFIGKNVSISPQVKIITADHDLNQQNCMGRERKVILEDYVFIGHSALILGDTLLQKGSAIGAMAVFRGKTESFGLYVGNPAKLKTMRPINLSYKMGYDRLFH